MSRVRQRNEQRLDRLQKVGIGYALGVLVLIGVLVGTGIAPLTRVDLGTPISPPASVTSAPAPGIVAVDRRATVITATSPPAIPTATTTQSTVSIVSSRTPVPTAPEPARDVPTPLPATLGPPIMFEQTTTAFQQGLTQDVRVDPDGALTLTPALADDFVGSALDLTQWQVTPWGTGGTATVHDGGITVNIAAIRSRQTFVHRTLEARVRFTRGAQPLQNIAWSADLNGTTAILIGEPPSDPDHLYARVKHDGEADRLVPLPVSLDDSAYHTYRIAWGNDQVDFSVDDVLRGTIRITLDQPMSAWVSAASASSLTADRVQVLDYGAAAGSFTALPLDARERVAWQTLMVRGTVPTGTHLTVRTRSSPDGVQWTEYAMVNSDGSVMSPPGRYLQYTLEFNGTATSTPLVTAVVATAVRGIRE